MHVPDAVVLTEVDFFGTKTGHSMEKPPARPEGALIRLVRKAAQISVPEAARLAGISKARWTQIESGRESRNGIEKEVNAKADTLAHMAHAVGVAPDRLEAEGGRPDAAEVLREILRDEEARASIPAPLRPVTAWEGDGPEAEFIAKILRRLSPEDQAVIRFIMKMTDGEDRPWSWERKLLEIEKYVNSVDSAGSADGSGQSRPAAGLRSPIRARAFARMRRNSCTVMAVRRDLIHPLG